MTSQLMEVRDLVCQRGRRRFFLLLLLRILQTGGGILVIRGKQANPLFCRNLPGPPNLLRVAAI